MKKILVGKKKILGIFIFSVLFGCFVHAVPLSSFRLVVSAGALADQDPYQPFYSSRIFIAEQPSPIMITDANAAVFESESALFYSADGIAPTDIVSKAAGVTHTSAGFIGYGYRGFLLDGNNSDEVRRYLGADSAAVAAEKKTLDKKTIWAFSKNTTAKQVVWPKAGDKLRRIPAVRVTDAQGGVYLAVARLVGTLTQRLGVIDGLLAQKNIKSGFIDLGTNHAEAKAIQADSVTALAKRKPLAVFPGTLEMSALIANPQSLTALPTVYPFGDNVTRFSPTDGTQKDSAKIHFWSITKDEALWPLYGKLGKKTDLTEAITAMKKVSLDPNRTLNVVRVFSEDAARDAAKSVYVDLVLLLAKDPFAQLPSKEIIELKKAKTDAYEQVAPIVKISYLDVSEVVLLGPSLGNVQRVEVTRHFISDEALLAKDVAVAREVSVLPALPALISSDDQKSRPWQREDLQKVLGGIAISHSKADIAIVETLPETTAIHGAIPLELAKGLLNPGGNLAQITTTGKQIKKVIKLINSRALGKSFSVYGMDAKANLIGERAILDNERFTVALSESSLLALFGLSRLGGLGEEYAIRAPFVESIYGDYKSFYYIGGPRVIAISDTTDEIEKALSAVRAGTPFADVLARSFATDNPSVMMAYIKTPQGRPRHVVTFSVDYLDVGFSKNVTNTNYRSTMDSFPISRGTLPIWAHLFLYSKLALTYDVPGLITSLTNETKYMHTDLDSKPEKDKVKFGLKFKLPWERSVFRGKPVVVAPIFKTVYETKIVPSFWSTPTKPKPLPPRTQRIDSLLGVNVDFTKLGFNFDVGATMATDFTRQSVNDAIDVGPALNFFSKWTLFGPVELSSEINSYYLFPVPGNMATNKLALGVEGTVWLRLLRFHDFSVAAISDILVATLQDDPKTVVLSSIFGLTLSYGRLFRLFG